MEHAEQILLPVKLNVGGHYFTTSVQTPTKDPKSMLAILFFKLFEAKPCEDGAFFIDRDGTHFRFILNYLRTGKLTLPEGATFLKELEEEAGFYQIQGMLEELKLMSKNLAMVNLNVGGRLFTTSLQTLTKDPNSILAAMFKGEFEVKRSSDGTFLIDRDGKHFRYILNYLRDGELILPRHDEEAFLKELETEAKYYQIQGMLNEIKLDSEILTNEEHRRVLFDWLPQRGECRLRLLFRASRDGFAAETFHSKCDNKGPTVTIVKSGDNIFGGFVDVPWKGGLQVEYITAGTDSFLFSMVNPQGLGPTKMAPQNDRKSMTGTKAGILCDRSKGPTFGNGQGFHGRQNAYDLHIKGNANVKSSLTGSSSSHLGLAYNIPPGPIQDPFFLAGAEEFIVTNYEVFRLYF